MGIKLINKDDLNPKETPADVIKEEVTKGSWSVDVLCADICPDLDVFCPNGSVDAACVDVCPNSDASCGDSSCGSTGDIMCGLGPI